MCTLKCRSSQSLIEPRRHWEAEAAGRPCPSEAPPTTKKSRLNEAPPIPRPCPCALAQVGKRRSTGAQAWWSHRPAAARSARSSFPGRGASER